MAPIRVALIGLSQNAKTSWASQGHLPYLLSERGKSRFKIVALLNSSVEAAKKAIQGYELPSDVKAYSSPHELAADANVDLAVCVVRVDKHFETIQPSVAAGKNVLVEWPLAENVSRAEELAELARTSGSKTVVGLQGRVAPMVLKVRQLLQEGAIGKVVGAEVNAHTPGGGGWSMSEGLAYFLDKKVGGNPITIGLGHLIDSIHFVLGEYDSSHSHAQIQRPHQSIVDAKTGAQTPTTSDVPDVVSVHGTLKTSEWVSEGASLFVTLRSGPPFPGTMPFVWVITGEKGRIRMTCERGPYIQATASEFPIPIEVETFATGEVEQVAWEWEDWQVPLLGRGRSIARLYDILYEGRLEEYRVADFDAAVVRHAQIDKVLW